MGSGRSKVIVLTEMNLSSGQGASFGRISSYAKALDETHDFFITSWKAENNGFEKIGSNLFISKDFSITGKNKIYRVLLEQFTFRRAYHYLQQLIDPNKSETVYLLYSHNFSLVVTALFFVRQRLTTLVYEKNELDSGIALALSDSFRINPLRFFVEFPIRIFSSLLIDLLSFFFPRKILISTNLFTLYKHSNKNYLIPPLVDTTVFQPVSLSNNAQVKLLYAGAISLTKDGLSESIEAMAKLPHEKSAEISFDIVGEGRPYIVSHLNRLIKKNNLDQVVHINPFIPYSKMSALYAGYDIVMMPRRRNLQNRFGFSTKMAEALACGKLVIATNVSDNSKYLKHLKNCYLINKISSSEIADSLTYFFNSRHEVHEICKNARICAEDIFSIYSNRKIIREAFSC
jgi:glycosyltransferase involved in cell wall biosynthesis